MSDPDNRPLWKLDIAEITKLSMAATKHGPVLRLTIETALIPEVDVSGLAHHAFGQVSEVTIAPFQAILPKAVNE